MRIGIYDPYLDTLSGGEKYMLSAASCLAKEHKVFIFWDKDKDPEWGLDRFFAEKVYENDNIVIYKS